MAMFKSYFYITRGYVTRENDDQPLDSPMLSYAPGKTKKAQPEIALSISPQEAAANKSLMGGSLPFAGVGQCPTLCIVSFETSH